MKAKNYYLLIIGCVLFFIANVVLADVLTFDVRGVTPDLQKNIDARLTVDSQALGQTLNASQVRELYHEGVQSIQAAIQPFGYFKAIVTPVALRHKDGVWVGFFNVDLGAPLEVTDIAVNVIGPGELDAKVQAAINDFPLKKYDRLQTAVYEVGKADLLERVQERGFIKALYSQSDIKIDMKSYQATITLTIETGERYYFGDINYKQTAYSPVFLNRIKFFNQGEAFSNARLQAFQQEMEGSGYFKQVDVVPDLDHIAHHSVPLNVNLFPPKSQLYSAGIGYGTFTGPRLIGKAQFPRVTDTGQYFNSELKLSSVLSGLAAKYFIPGRNPLRDKYVLGVGFQQFSPKNGKSDSGNLSASYLTKWGKHWRASATLNFLVEHYEVLNQPSLRRHFLYPSLNIIDLKTDNVVNPTSGKTINLTLQGAADQMFSSTGFIQSEIQGKYLFSPTANSRVVFRGDVGYTVVEKLKNLPLTLRFFAGGINSIRGYPDSSIGPSRYLYEGSAEYRHRVWDQLYGAVFYDVGTATDSFGTPLNVGTGVGAVYESVVGPIKLYVAKAISKHNKPYSIEFAVGAEF